MYRIILRMIREYSKRTFQIILNQKNKMEISYNLKPTPNTFPHGRHTLPDIDTLGYIQCVTCGKMLGNLYNRADELRRKNLTELEVYETLGLKRTCCRYHLTLGIKMPMVKYLDENVRLDLVGTVDEDVQENIDSDPNPRSSKDGNRDKDNGKNNDSDKVNGIKSRLAKLRDASNQVMGNKLVNSEGSSDTTNTKRISMFVAT